MILKMAYLNMWRRRSRSLVVMLMVAISVTGLLLMQGIYDGMITQMVDNSIRSDSGEISIYGKDHRLNKTLKTSIPDYRPLETYLQNDPEVASYIVRIRHEGLAATARHSLGVELVGTDLASEHRHAQLENFLLRGDYTFDARHRGALIGYDLADKLKVDVGSKLIVTAQNLQGDLVSLALKVRGVLKTGNVAVDKNSVLLDYTKLHDLLGLDNQATQISVNLRSKNLVAAADSRFESAISGYGVEVFTWKQLFPLFDQMDEIMVTFNLVSYGLVFIVAAIGIFGVILVSVLERVREFGIMLAIGNAFGDIRNLILLESMLLGLFGLILGTLAGGALLLYFNRYGIDLTAWSEGLSMWGVNAVMYADIKAGYFLQSLVAVLLATLFAALWPIRILKKLHPIEAINL